MDAILLTDGYKLDHRRQYPEGTQFVYSNWTPRSCAYYPEAEEGVVVSAYSILSGSISSRRYKSPSLRFPRQKL